MQNLRYHIITIFKEFFGPSTKYDFTILFDREKGAAYTRCNSSLTKFRKLDITFKNKVPCIFANGSFLPLPFLYMMASDEVDTDIITKEAFVVPDISNSSLTSFTFKFSMKAENEEEHFSTKLLKGIFYNSSMLEINTDFVEKTSDSDIEIKCKNYELDYMLFKMRSDILDDRKENVTIPITLS